MPSVRDVLTGPDPEGFWKLKCFNQAHGDNPFSDAALAEYLAAFAKPDAIHASCEDYRAAASIDLAHDDADPSKLQMPLLALWGRDGAIEAHFDCLALWRERADDVRGWALPGGHYLAEECPDQVIQAWRSFFNEALTFQS